MPNGTLKTLSDMRERVFQKNRIAFGNRLAAIDSGRDKASATERASIVHWHSRFEEMESEVNAIILEEAAKEPIIEMASAVRGVGVLSISRVVSHIDISRADTVSALWRYAGFAVFNGERERPVKGVKLAYNRRLKTACYLLGTNLIRANSPYRRIYDEAKVHYEKTHPEWTKMHRHLAAIRKMVKIFLSHLWERWRILEGLPTRTPFALEKLGHTTKYTPEEFGWP